MAMSMATSRERPSFDRIIAQAQSRSRSNSANSANLLDSLPPPPRRRKPVSPPSLTTSSASSLPMQKPQISVPGAQLHQGSDSNPFSNPPVADADSQLTPSPFAHWEEGPPAHKYADSLSSLNSYSNLFYKPEDDANASPIIRPADDHPTDRASFDDAASTEDYSDLLYPDLQAPTVGPSHSPRPSIEVHGPPMRKRMSSFTSHEGPESPVEFANMGKLSMPPHLPAFEEYLHRPSKVERLLGMDSQASSRRGSSDRLMLDQARRDSFIEFDITSFRPSPHPSEVALRGQPSTISDEMPIFAPRHMGPILSSNSIGVYKALIDSVDHVDRTDGSPRLDSRQILVDGSDRPKPARSAPLNQGSNRSSVSSPPLDSRLSTSNFLDKKERADLMRKHRKIVQVLGPGVVPSTQALARAGRSTPTSETSEVPHDLLHRSTRSETLVFDETKSEGERKPRTSGLIPRRPPNLEATPGWSALEHDTIFLNANGRRHSSPLNATFDSLGMYQRLDPDISSMSSLGSIIGQEGRGTSSASVTRPRTPDSFMEMSDEEGGKTPKRRPSIESAQSPVVHEFQRTQRAASLNDLLTVSSALESPRRVSIPDTLPTDTSSSFRPRNRPVSEVILEFPFREKLSIRGDYSPGRADNDDIRMERQRKREKLAKIHRYLGSKVPAELVLGYSSSYSPSHATTNSIAVMERVVPDARQQEVKKRRRSSSAVAYHPSYASSPPRHAGTENRSKESTLTDGERMMKIRRAQKIEQIFGESPTRPRSLSIPRPSSAQGLVQNQLATPTTPLKRTTVATPIPEHQPTERGFKPRSPFVWKEGRPSTAGSSRPSTATSTTGLMASYQKDTEKEKKSRAKNQQVDMPRAKSNKPQFPIGTALGSPWEDVYASEVLDISANATTVYSSKSPVIAGVATSRQYLDYRNSLNSLSRILDHDDRQSLNDLHAVLDSDEEDDDPDLHSSALPSGSIDIQRMLQPRASLVSINSVATTSTFATLTPDPMAFQARRKRAAKLAHFFGASYRDLFGEVLVRIERGMLEEARAGQISEEEVKHLMKQLNRLKSRQSQLS